MCQPPKATKGGTTFSPFGRPLRARGGDAHMTRRRFTVVVVPVILLFISVSSCMRARMADSTGATGARGTTPTEALLPPPAPPESYIGVQLCRACHPAIAATFSETKMGRLFL